MACNKSGTTKKAKNRTTTNKQNTQTKKHTHTHTRQATKMKVKVTAIFGHANNVSAGIYGEPENQVAPTPEWSWAANEDNGGMLKKLLKTVKSKCTGFHTRWLTEEIGDVKKSTSTATQASELTSLLLLESDFEQIREHVDTMVTRHNARPRKKAREA